MSEKIIPEHIDPYRYAEQSLQLAGFVKIADMQRLSANLSLNNDHVAVDLRFGRDEQKIVYLKGHLETKLVLQCQRCMEPFVYDIISDFALGVVNTLDEANALPDHYEPALAVEGQLALRELIEDEIILNLPIIPRHEPEDCSVSLPTAESGWTDQGKGENPFHVLKSLKHK
ncbi:MAG: YceD family protein [Gammaproteobacteria bacterium]